MKKQSKTTQNIWALRIIMLVALGFLIAPRPIYVMFGAPQDVETDHPILCVHTRLIDEVEEWKIQRSLEMVREMGATTIVEFFPWPYVEGSEGKYNWEQSDRIVAHARSQGLTIIARLGMVPAWAQPEPDTLPFDITLNYIEPGSYSLFADYVEAFTTHYKDEIQHVIIWNEPNLSHEWGYQPVIPENYVNLLSLASDAARRGNPDIVVLAGALAPTLEPAGSPFGYHDIEYLRALYNAGFKDMFDVLAVHTYGFKFPPEDPPAEDVMNFRRMELLRDVMIAYGDGDKPVIITESGWNDHPRWTKAVSPGQRIAYTTGGLEFAESNWPYVEVLCQWVFRFPAPTNSYQDYFTLVGSDFTPRLIYEELRMWALGDQG